VTRVLPAFVIALLAIAPSAVSAFGNGDTGSPGATVETALGETGSSSFAHDRPVAEVVDTDDERTLTLRFFAGLPTGPGALVAHAAAEDLRPRARIVDGRALARRTFAAQRFFSRGSGDPDAAA
jgi:hypothetical protein